MSKTENDNTANIYKADKSLQAKVGAGPFDRELIKRAQDVIENNNVDFKPDAQATLLEISATLQSIKDSPQKATNEIAKLTALIMQLKANGSVFGYPLLGNLANIMLIFLEAIDEINTDVIDILNANYQTLNAIIIKDLKGDGGDLGNAMEEELQNACNRYFNRHKK